jgi:SAM-dependent methyltransferase
VLRAEAAWLAGQLEHLPSRDLSPLLSIGSGHPELRRTQPWTFERIYEPLARRGVRLLHHELDEGPDVDVAGDLTDPAFLLRLPEVGARSVMCCNVLEHLPNPLELAAAIQRSVARGGYVFVTVPRRYPFHPGPIDTMFRPTPAELRALFPELGVEQEAEIRTESLLRYLFGSPTKWTSIAHGLRFLGRSERRKGPSVPLRDKVGMLLFSTAVSAVVLRATP